MMHRLALCAPALLFASCMSTPAVTTMEPRESGIEILSIPAHLIAAAEAPAAALAVEAREIKGVKGAAIEFVIAGTPEEVLAMHLDIENMEGHRSVAESFELIERAESSMRAIWHLKRHKIIKPTITLRYDFERAADGTIELEYELEKGALGVAANFGRKLFLPLPGTPARTLVRWETYFSTGMPLFKISEDELIEAMRDDVALLREWQTERLAR